MRKSSSVTKEIIFEYEPHGKDLPTELEVRGELVLEDQSFDYDGPNGIRTHKMPSTWVVDDFQALDEHGNDRTYELWEWHRSEWLSIQDLIREKAEESEV